MIVRISTEGQFSLESSDLDQLNALDNRVVEAVAKEDQAGFAAAFDHLLDFVRQRGQPLPDTELVASDVMLPAPGLTLDEARHLFAGEGLIAG